MFDTLIALRALLKEETTILASAEDAAYFRTLAMKKSAPPPVPLLPKAIPKIEKREEAPPPAPPAEPPKETPKEEPKLETVLEPRRRVTSSFHLILEKVAPHLAIIDAIPNDLVAKQIANRWKTKNQSAPISILACGEMPEHRAFLEEIGVALDVYFGGAKLIEAEEIEKEKQWKTFLSAPGFKLIVICDSTLWQLTNLRQLYKESPAERSRELGGVPMFLLPDLSLYLKDPGLKRSLWKALCTKLS